MTFTELRVKYNHFVFMFGFGKLMEIGTEKAKQITDEFIEEAYKSEQERQENSDGMCVYTPEVIRDMFVVARELANLPLEDLINGFVKYDLFRCHEISYDRMTEIASAAINNLDDDAAEYFIADTYLEEDEAEFLNEELYNKFFNNEEDDYDNI